MNAIATRENIDLMTAHIIESKELEIVSCDEYTLIPQQSVLDEPFDSEGETLLNAIYHGHGMRPFLMPGDNVLLRKRNKLPYFTGEIFMIQIESGETVFCRPQESKKEGCIFARFDNPDYIPGRAGYDIDEKYIIAYWELIASQRTHSLSYARMIPIFKSTNFNQ